MKYRRRADMPVRVLSPPARGALVEIKDVMKCLGLKRTLPPARGALVEIPMEDYELEYKKSPPARGALVEMSIGLNQIRGLSVAPRKGGVDRNSVGRSERVKSTSCPPARH